VTLFTGSMLAPVPGTIPAPGPGANTASPAFFVIRATLTGTAYIQPPLFDLYGGDR
jgi:hypothetical protein